MSLPELDPLRILEIRIYPDPILKQVCEPIVEVTQEIKTLVQDMFLTMYNKGGVGLSANQVGITKRVFVMDTSESGNRRRVFINPEIIWSKDEQRWREGCLSFPDVFSYVKRPAHVKVKALDEEGKVFELDLEGIDAVCFQHELDHLNGVTFYDHLTPLQKNMIRKKMANLPK
jgi:peptide deformylase